MLPARVYEKDWEVDAKLKAEFGCSREELIHVVHRVVAARADSVDDDPLSASGQFAYIFGTRNVRGLFKRKGWVTHREENVEAVRNPQTGKLIVYQSVDVAASKDRSPRAVTGKGSGSRRIIDAAQGALFPDDAVREAIPDFLARFRPEIWYFCVSVDGDEVCAELSLPVSLEDGNFSGFFERIFIVSGGEWAGLRITDAPATDVIELQPKISRK